MNEAIKTMGDFVKNLPDQRPDWNELVEQGLESQARAKARLGPETPTQWLSCAETAKLVRKQLKTNFPGVKFSVRSSVYSGGASIRVNWMDGPTGKEVSRVTGQFQGGGFDGMIDMSYNVSHWLMPDGSTVVSHSPGTEGSRGVVPATENVKPHPDAVPVHFGSKHVFAERAYSARMTEDAVDALHERWGNVEQGGFDREAVEIKIWEHAERKGEAYVASNEIRVKNADEWLGTLVHLELTTRIGR